MESHKKKKKSPYKKKKKRKEKKSPLNCVKEWKGYWVFFLFNFKERSFFFSNSNDANGHLSQRHGGAKYYVQSIMIAVCVSEMLHV